MQIANRTGFMHEQEANAIVSATQPDRGWSLARKLQTSAKMMIATAFLTAAASAGTPVKLDFEVLKTQIDGADGASVCQFAHWKDGKAETWEPYSNLSGFPDDTRIGGFKRFCDVSFSGQGPDGMALHHIWATPSPSQSPPGSLSDTYSPEAFAKLDFSMYEPNTLSSSAYHTNNLTVKGHTTALMRAAVRRSRDENRRMLFWVDLHIDVPVWLWAGSDRKTPIPESNWNKTALHMVYFVKYLVERHGIPVHAVSMANEPDHPSRAKYSPEMTLKLCKILREKLDEAGLQGVKVIAATSISLDDVCFSWNKKLCTTYLNDQSNLLKGSMSQYARYVDFQGGHSFEGETPTNNRVANTPMWNASGSYGNYWDNGRADNYLIGDGKNLDELIRHNIWFLGKGLSLSGVWQYLYRTGAKSSEKKRLQHLDPEFNSNSSASPKMIDASAVVYPYVRPGMFLVGGSLARRADEGYSADGFSGRGQREVIVLTNSGSARTFDITLKNPGTTNYEMYRSTATSEKALVGQVQFKGGTLSVEVPGESVTSLVAAKARSAPRVYVVVQSTSALTDEDKLIVGALEDGGYDVQSVPDSLPSSVQIALLSKRHPVDAMGAALYVLSPSLKSTDIAYAHRSVMAPVLAFSADHSRALGLKSEATVKAGEALAFRDSMYGPPAASLENGLPRACGPRRTLNPGALGDEIRSAAQALIALGGAVSSVQTPSSTQPQPEMARPAFPYKYTSDGRRIDMREPAEPGPSRIMHR